MERITVDPQIHFGKPCVAGTRIPVQAVVDLLDEGLSSQEIIQDYYPDLSIEDIRACVEMAQEETGQDDLAKYSAKRKASNPQFAEGFEEGYAAFKIKVQQQLADGEMADNISEDET